MMFFNFFPSFDVYLCPINLIFQLFYLATNIQIVVELLLFIYSFPIWVGQIKSKLIYIFVTYELVRLKVTSL